MLFVCGCNQLCSQAAEIHHFAYSVEIPDNAPALWVRWNLSPANLTNKVANRADYFFADDPSTPSKEIDNAYSHSGFDRGHLCPSADMRFSVVAQKECFYLTNIIPQTPALNRGTWERLESLCREWCKTRGTLLIYAGAIYPPDIENKRFLHGSSIEIPSECWKVITCATDTKIYAIGFRMPNAPSLDLNPFRYVVPVSTLPTPRATTPVTENMQWWATASAR